MSQDLFELTHYRIRRKVLKVFGGSFHVYAPDGRLVAFSSQKAFKLREDIRVYTDESRRVELMEIHARQIIDFSAAYDLVDAREKTTVGALRRRGIKSILRDSWEVLDAHGEVVATLVEDSQGMALLRRLLTNLVPQRFHLAQPDGTHVAEFKQRFNPLVYSIEVEIPAKAVLDNRLVFGAAVLIAAIEGRQG